MQPVPIRISPALVSLAAMPVLVALTAAGAWLLIGAGVMKIRRPGETGHAIAVLTGAGESAKTARLLGMLEVIVAIGFIIWPSTITALLVATAYLLVFGTASILRSRKADCGCFGEASSRVGTAHLVVTLLSALAGLGLTLIGGVERSLEMYVLIVSASTVALGEFALIGPLSQLRARLADLRP